jgi:hypothetical protein
MYQKKELDFAKAQYGTAIQSNHMAYATESPVGVFVVSQRYNFDDFTLDKFLQRKDLEIQLLSNDCETPEHLLHDYPRNKKFHTEPKHEHINITGISIQYVASLRICRSGKTRKRYNKYSVLLQLHQCTK